MSVVLLVRLSGMASLYRVDTQEKDGEGNLVVRFAAWRDQDGVDLYWTGRRVDKVYTMGGRSDACVWYEVPIPEAVDSLLRRDLCVKALSEPSPEGRLPE